MSHIAVVLIGDVAIGFAAYGWLQTRTAKIATTLIGGWVFNALVWMAVRG